MPNIFNSMLETVFYFPWEVSLILFLQNTLPGFVLGFFEVIAEVVSKNVLALLFILIYLAYNKDWGKFTLLSLGVAGVCCEFVKVTVARLSHMLLLIQSSAFVPMWLTRILLTLKSRDILFQADIR